MAQSPTARPPDVHDHQPLGFRVWSGQTRGMSQAHRHQDVEINLPLDHPVTYLVRGESVTIPAGVFGLWWAAVPHQSLVSRTQHAMVWVTLPLRWLWNWGCPSGLANELLSGRVVTDMEPDASDAVRMRGWARQMARGEAAWVRIVQLELEARMRRLMAGGVRVLAPHDPSGDVASDRPGTGRTPEAVRVMAEVIATRFRDPLTVAEIAAAAHLHPSHAMRLFRAHLHQTVVDYLTRQRVAEAQRLLITTDLPIQSVGLRSGFGSSSRFYAAFRQLTGTTPKRYQQDHRSAWQ